MGVCVPRAFGPSGAPNVLARWRVRGPAGTGSVGDGVGEGLHYEGLHYRLLTLCPVPTDPAARAGPRLHDVPALVQTALACVLTALAPRLVATGTQVCRRGVCPSPTSSPTDPMPAGPRTAGRPHTRHLARKFGGPDGQNTPGTHARTCYATRRAAEAGVNAAGAARCPSPWPTTTLLSMFALPASQQPPPLLPPVALGHRRAAVGGRLDVRPVVAVGLEAALASSPPALARTALAAAAAEKSLPQPLAQPLP